MLKIHACMGNQIVLITEIKYKPLLDRRQTWCKKNKRIKKDKSAVGDYRALIQKTERRLKW